MPPVTFGEVLVGIVLILGIWTDIASFFGNFMNTNSILAGAVSANPKLVLMLLFQVLTRHIGGYYGLD